MKSELAVRYSANAEKSGFDKPPGAIADLSASAGIDAGPQRSAAMAAASGPAPLLLLPMASAILAK